ncbi:signal-regulatory protein beta-2-like, partial [Clarias magur]
VNFVGLCLGTALVMCAILISVQAVLLCKRKNCNQYRERFQRGAVTNTEYRNTP